MNLSEAMVARIREYGVKVCGTDSEAAAELTAHLEDQMLDYLRGTRALNEEEAFVLALEHLGPIASVRRAYRSSRPPSEFGQRCLLSLVAFFLASFVGSLITPLAALVDAAFNGAIFSYSMMIAIMQIGYAVASAGVFIILLRRWWYDEDKLLEARSWIRRRSPRGLALLTATLTLFWFFPLSVRIDFLRIYRGPLDLPGWWIQGAAIASTLAMMITWLWFLSGRQVSMRTRLQAAVVVLGIATGLTIFRGVGFVVIMNGSLSLRTGSLMGIMELPNSTILLSRVLRSVAVLAVGLLILWVRDQRAARPIELAS